MAKRSLAETARFVHPSQTTWGGAYHQWQRGEEGRHEETDLPCAIGPFCITNFDADKREFLPVWWITFEDTRGRLKRVGGKHADIFDAFIEMVGLHRKWLPTRPRAQVYFIGTELRVGKPVKIGTSSDPKARLATLQTGFPHKLQIFATTDGGPEVEARYHTRWRNRRCNGEWFTLGDCIIEEIERLSGRL